MRKPYHICMSGGEELICRTDEDYYRLFNCIALAAYETDTVILADAEMSSHIHLGVRSDNPYEMIQRAWLMYSRYFNSKYKRRGRLGEQVPFVLELHGLQHVLAALCYILRNPLHHGLSPTPFGYRHSSANVYFRNELGKFNNEELIPERQCHRYLPRLSNYPSTYKMNKSGVYVRETVIDTAEVENMFVTPRSFLYYMNRLSGEEWKKEQENDNNQQPPITLNVIENGVNLQTLDRMLANENGRSGYNALTDIDVCTIIDSRLVTEMTKSSVYQFTSSDLTKVISYLRQHYSISETQARRCLAASYSRK